MFLLVYLNKVTTLAYFHLTTKGNTIVFSESVLSRAPTIAFGMVKWILC